MTMGDTIGRYRVLGSLGQGGMASVFLAMGPTHGGGERRVAVKVVDANRTRDAEACAQLLHEGRLAGMLHHHNVAQVYEVAREGDRHFLAMEYIDGVDLRGLLNTCGAKGMMPSYDVALAIVAQAAAGLDYAHRRCDPTGRPLFLVHRDVSLSNIMVGRDGVVKVVDFGIARSTLSTVHTSPGIVRGKASYMSPEQCVGDVVDHRTDVFALGIVLYELTTGARCFDGENDFERMVAVVRGAYTPPSAIVANYPVGLERVVRKALAHDVADRYQSCAQLLDAIEGVMRAYDWRGGEAAIARAMRQVFGAADELEEMTVVDVAPRTFEQPVVEPRRPWYVDEEEAMTRGRRPLARWSATQIAA